MKKIEVTNAVLRKDMIVDMKRPKMMLLMLGINLLLTAILAIVFALVMLMGIVPTQIGFSPRAMVTAFCVMVWFEEIVIVFLVPALTAGSISIEKERQTLEVLLTTRMSTWQIVTGKYFSTVSQITLLVISGFPILCVMFLYGGINLFQMFTILAVLISSTMFFASFGIFYSALIKNTILSVILTYITIGVVLVATFSLTVMGMLIMVGVNEILCEVILKNTGQSVQNVIGGDAFIFLLCWNPLATLFDAIGQVFGYGIGDAASINGIKDIPIFMHFTSKNLLLRFFPFLSVGAQLLTTFLLLRAAAFFLKPVKGKKKVKKKAVNQARN